MPNKDGSGPAGRGMGQGRGSGGGRGAGPSGYCLCPKCGKRIPHKRGTPCIQLSCPNCGERMTRA